MTMQKVLLGTTALCAAALIGMTGFQASASAATNALPLDTDEIIYAVNDSGDGIVNLRYSTDNGETWTELDPELVDIECNTDGEENISVTMTDAELIEGDTIAIQYDTETGEVLQSNDGGLTWEPLDADVNIEFEENANSVSITSVAVAD